MTAISWWPDEGGGGGGFPTTAREVYALNRRLLARELKAEMRSNLRLDALERAADREAAAVSPAMPSAFGVAGGTGQRGALLRDLMLSPEAAIARDEVAPTRTTLGASRAELLSLGLQRTFVTRLQRFVSRLRRWYPLQSFPITSALRSPAQNSEAGGVQFSAHLWGDAVDFAYSTPDQLWAWDVGEAARRAKLQAIVYPSHVHLEISPDGRVGLASVGTSISF